MKSWKIFLVAISIAILPFALVGVGQAQQLNCWGLAPNRTEKHEDGRCSRKPSVSKRETIHTTRDAIVTLFTINSEDK